MTPPNPKMFIRPQRCQTKTVMSSMQHSWSTHTTPPTVCDNKIAPPLLPVVLTASDWP